MKIGVCVKKVPPSDVRMVISDDGSSVDGSVYSRLEANPYDEHALEAAVALKDQGVASEVILITFDKPDKPTEKQIISFLGCGADRAVIVSNDELGESELDALGVAKVLKAVVDEEGIQAVFCGQQSTDGNSAAVPAMLAELLQWPYCPLITKLECEDEEFTVWTDIGAGSRAVIKTSAPSLFSCDKGLNKPRSPKLKERLNAKKKPRAVKSLSDLGLSVDDLAAHTVQQNWTLPTKRDSCKFIDLNDSPQTAVNELVRLLREEAKVI